MRMKQQAQYPCRNCIYFHTCGENTRTEYCAGRTTKSENKAIQPVIKKEMKIMEAWTSDILAAYEEAKGNNYEEE